MVLRKGGQSNKKKGCRKSNHLESLHLEALHQEAFGSLPMAITK
jgi:hypothetical protein